MDTLLQDLRSALHAIGEHPGLALAAMMSLGFRLEVGVARDAAAPHQRQPVPTAHAAAPSRAAASWMDYIDFRRGSGDVLRWIGSSDMAETPPHTCGVTE
jgi:hypothetical protein